MKKALFSFIIIAILLFPSFNANGFNLNINGKEMNDGEHAMPSPSHGIFSFLFSFISANIKTSNNGGIDQQQENAEGYVEIYGTKYFAQSFIPQTYGKMTGLDLFMGRKGIASMVILNCRPTTFNGKLVVSVYRNLGSLGIQDQLASVSLDPWELNRNEGWVHVDFGEGFKVKIGETYYIVVHQEGGDEHNYYRWYYGNDNVYSNGSFYEVNGNVYNGNWSENESRDFCFREYGEYSGEEPDGVVERWAVIIGVLDSSVGTCYYADQDAYDMYRVLVDHGWQGSHIRVLISPTTSEVDAAMNWLGRMDDPDDISLLCWTSHGGHTGFATKDDGVSYQAVGNWLDELDSQGILVIAENCNSGAAIPYLEKDGRVILTSCRAGESSGSDDTIKNSIFIYFLADETGVGSSKLGYPTPKTGKDGAFARDDPDTNSEYGGNNDGWVSAEEAYKYAYKWTVKATESSEYPMHPQISDMYPGDLNIVKRM
jgi:hypothetical protein